MTSLFRRRNSGNHGDVASHSDSPVPAELNNGNPSGGGRTVRRLEFNQAMEDFSTMFPSMEQEVIECVLRANHGAVDSTIDQLLQMSLEGHGSDDGSDSEDSIPPEILERTLEPDSSDEEPPPVYSPPSYDMHIYDRKYPDQVLPTAPPGTHPPASQRQIGSYRNWNPPLLGNLPDDFLRILPQQLDSLPLPGALAGQVGMETDQERKLKQYLEDERIALFLQNEEFMRELQRNREFLIALERGVHTHTNVYIFFIICSGEACTNVTDDALFRDKLKHMGKSTRKKLFEIARAFSENTRRRKTKRRALMKHHSIVYKRLPLSLTSSTRLGNAASTANLLEDEEAGHLSGTFIHVVLISF
uniref:CUE domain containing 1a n=1 Tax=Oncorhynchus mykiss TaxID=8022 RepID=A0A8L0DSF8_ONCMY